MSSTGHETQAYETVRLPSTQFAHERRPFETSPKMLKSACGAPATCPSKLPASVTIPDPACGQVGAPVADPDVDLFARADARAGGQRRRTCPSAPPRARGGQFGSLAPAPRCRAGSERARLAERRRRPLQPSRRQRRPVFERSEALDLVAKVLQRAAGGLHPRH